MDQIRAVANLEFYVIAIENQTLCQSLQIHPKLTQNLKVNCFKLNSTNCFFGFFFLAAELPLSVHFVNKSYDKKYFQ